MKIAALYDIHGNAPALEAVLEEALALNVDALVIGGDTVAGPLPVATLARLDAVSVPVYHIHGNGESEMLRAAAGLEPNGLTPVADEDARWVAGELDDAQIDFIKTWPTTVELVMDGLGSVVFCHATPQDDITIFTEETEDALVMEMVGAVSAEILICGHTHMQFDRQLDGLRVINAGSVGAPFGGTGAYWLLIDGSEITHRHTTYDLGDAATRIKQSSASGAVSFVDNRVLKAPSKADIMPVLRKFQAQQAASAT